MIEPLILPTGADNIKHPKMFNIRLVTLDHYMSKPIDELHEGDKNNFLKDWQEPVLRIFGATPNGVKSCVHVHGVYPYIYVPYKGGENPDRDALLLGAALNEALRSSLGRKILKFVYKVTPTSGIPLYGYHSKHRQYFKIYFYNPYHIRKASELLLSGAILGQKFQPHEAHIPYALQFMMDYNVYGMSFVAFSRVKFRRNPENPDTLAGVKEEDILSEKVKKITWSCLEADAMASDIVNRVGQRTIGVNPGLQAIWEDERERRRQENRSSQITIQQSLSRPEVNVCPSEVMYKAQLAQRLAEISPQESGRSVISDEPMHSYPAEVPESGSLLEVSAIDEAFESPPQEMHVEDVSSLIDERILTQISESPKEKVESESEDETEFDSVLGRNQKAEEVELEDEEGVDMTQPLDSYEEVICGAEGNRDEPGNSSRESEATFWKGMADKILQLDGALESSSESDVEATSSGSSPGDGTSGDAPEHSTAWSNNIMSILSEGSSCPTPSAVCQTPRTFWTNYSSNWSSQNQDPWGWNRNGAAFPDFGGKNQSDGLNLGDFPEGPKEIPSVEPYDDLFGGGCFPAGLPHCNAESATSFPSAILTPTSEADVNLDTICENFQLPSTKEKRKSPSIDSDVAESKVALKGNLENDRQTFLQVLKSFSGRKVPSENDCRQLTLKQYIKDCKEIVSVDFKNLCNQEMIIIEYKSQNKRSLRNKYLIKPLDKFLESWNSAERKASDRLLSKNSEGAKVINGLNFEEGENLHSVINVLEKTFSDSSTVQSLSNKLTVKSMEILPDGGSGKDRCYNVNENVISRGKIKMKLIKSQREKVQNNLVERTLKRRSEKFRRLDLKRLKDKTKEGSGGSNVGSRRKSGKAKKSQDFSEPDSKLINEINSSFEEYFKTIVKRKNLYVKKKGIERRYDEEDEVDNDEAEKEEKEETSEDEAPNPSAAGAGYPSSNTDPIKFVTRFLSTFSRMSDVPPLSITISLGNGRGSAPVQVNLQSSAIPSEKEVKYYSKTHRRRKTKIENVDGPADDLSSSEDTDCGEARQRPSDLKKSKKGPYYKPLNVIVYGSSEKGSGKKRKMFSCGSPERTASEAKRGRKSYSGHPSKDPLAVCREKPKSWPLRVGKEEETLSESPLNPPNATETSLDVKEKVSFDQEEDFIYDSDEDKKWKRIKARRKSGKFPKLDAKAVQQRIPQADTEAFTSSDEELKHIHEKVFTHLEPQMSDRGLSLDDKVDELEAGKSDLPGVVDDQLSQRLSVTKPTTGDSSQEPTPPNSGSTSRRVDNPFKNVLTQPTFKSSQSPLPYSGSSQPISQSSGPTGTPEVCSGEKSLGSIESTPTEHEPSLDWVIGSKTLKPKHKPLTRKEVVESLHEHDIFEGETNAPFYSDFRDATKAVEKGPRVLKIENRSLGGLKTFKSSLDILGGEERRNLLSIEQGVLRQSVGDGVLEITPVLKPPSSGDVAKWFQKRESERRKETVESEKAKIKVVQPLSPGEDVESDEEMELSVTITSFSGEAEAKSNKDLSEDSPQGSKRSDPSEAELGLKKGPLSKIKGIKRFSLMKKLSTISEEGQPTDNSKVPPTQHPNPSNSSSTPKSGSKTSSKDDNSFQIRGVTLENTFGFSHSVENRQICKLSDTHQYMSMIVMELQVQTRRNLRPDPEMDPIHALFYAITFDNPEKSQETGMIVVGEQFLLGTTVSGYTVHYVPTEKALIEKLLELLREWDPEILAGYEIEMNSWGYLVQRGFILEMNLLLLLGRVQSEEFVRKGPPDIPSTNDEINDAPRSIRHMRISGRIVLDIWRVLRHEIALTSYTFENVMYHLMQERHPLLSYERLSYYWEHPSRRFRHIVVEYFVTRVNGIIRVLDQLDFISRTSELSRLFGIQFYEVLSRGSQFRVESMMLRLAKPLNYVPTSPSIAQRAAMRAPASLPLILEPESLFYTDPVIVLDFQSLYPSMIIAYNYCFSTCLGRVEKLGGREPFEFGCTQLQISPEELRKLENDITISPAGIVFVKSNIRKGVLPTMLEEILETRLMVKKSMKENKNNKILQKVLYARQLGLKLIANVTYGYTAANFSGRMPCIEVGDSVVSKGRETLHRAIQLVKNTRKWGARVVYGDTDSIFVLTPGRTREEAFKIGAEIAEAVTQDNPKPVKLKLEKVYHPCILQTKKRYVGYMFEGPDQEKPVFEAKGIETVRRDGCPAIGKILEKALRILFDTGDVSLVKKYTVRQFAKLSQGRVNVHDLVFAKEYRGRKGYRPGACVPALYLAREWTQHDKRAEPRVKERVPYVIVNGPPGVPLIRLVRSPKDLISDPSLRINAVYYITKAIIPPMDRCFSLLGADVLSWYAEMPRRYHKTCKSNLVEGQKRKTISQYFAATECVVCREITNAPVCPKCETQPQTLAVTVCDKIRRGERCHESLMEVCRCCCGRTTEPDCVSLDCPVLFRRQQARRDLEEGSALRGILNVYL